MLARLLAECVSISMLLARTMFNLHFVYAQCLKPTSKLSFWILEIEQQKQRTVVSALYLFALQVVFEIFCTTARNTFLVTEYWRSDLVKVRLAYAIDLSSSFIFII